MRRLARFLMTVGVATALLGSSLIAQVQKVAKPEATTIVVTKVEVKVGDGARAVVPAKAAVPVKAADVAKGAVMMKMAMPVAANKPDLAALIQQFKPQCRPMIRSELHLITSLCSPTKEQRVKLAAEGEKLLTEVVTTYAEAQAKMMLGQWRGGAMPDPNKQIHEGLPKILKSILSTDQSALYEAEVKRREDDRRQSAARSLVARLDQIVVLSKEQREKITDAVVAGWNDSWGHNLEQFFASYGDRYFPTVPDAIIVPTLNAMQKDVYRGTQKSQVNFGGFGFRGGIEMEEEILDVPAAPAGADTVTVTVKANEPAKANAKQAVKQDEAKKK